jgi:methionyl-tRNA formyltransferase
MPGLRLLFMGTPAFALPALELLHRSAHKISAVVTQPDRISGRGQIINYSAVKKWTLSNVMEIYQPEKLSEESFIAWLGKMQPDLIVTVAFGRLLNSCLLQTPPLGCINLHASYLPAYRGAAPIHRAIMEGSHFSGVSIIDLTEELDGGDIYDQKQEPIYPDDTAGLLHDRLAVSGASLLLKTVNALADGSAVKKPQDPALVSYAPPLVPLDEIIDWNLKAEEIHNRIRGLNPWPGAYTTFRGRRLKIWKSKLAEASRQDERVVATGTVYRVNVGSIDVVTGEGLLTLVDLQPAGKKTMDASAFCCGYQLKPGDRLGDG